MTKKNWKSYWKSWLHAAGIRAVKTMAQTAVGVIGASTVISAVDWKVVVSASVLAGVVSILTSVTGLPEVPKDTDETGEEGAV